MDINLFYITGGIAIAAALLAITRREAMHGILYLVVVLVALAMLFFLLGAPFIAALEIIVYAGAIVILFLFVIMMLNPPAEGRGTVVTGWFGPLVLVGILAIQWVFFLKPEGRLIAASPVSLELLGRTFFENYAYALHLVALFLLVGLVGAFHLGRTERDREES